jgi:hypothetical protein
VSGVRETTLTLHKAVKNTFSQQTNNTANNNKPATKQPVSSNVVFGIFGNFTATNNEPTTIEEQLNKTTIFGSLAVR